MLFKNIRNGRMYEVVNPPDASGVCQVLDIKHNYLVLMKYEELEDATASALNLLHKLHETLKG